MHGDNRHDANAGAKLGFRGSVLFLNQDERGPEPAQCRLRCSQPYFGTSRCILAACMQFVNYLIGGPVDMRPAARVDWVTCNKLFIIRHKCLCWLASLTLNAQIDHHI